MLESRGCAVLTSYNRDIVLLPPPIRVPLGAATDATLEALPDTAAVFLLWPSRGTPYLARTSLLRRRLVRLLRERTVPSRILNLREVSERLEYWPVQSALGGSLLQFEVARQHFPRTYQKLLKLRWPAYLKLLLGNPFPRFQVTSKLAAGAGVYYGPFRTRAEAELFETVCLDHFLIRRCQEDLHPSPEHPGCVYGEMRRCLRPCQGAVDSAEYAGEVLQVRQYLTTGGPSLIGTLEQERDQASANLNFEEAARLHQKIEKARQCLPGENELPRLLDRLHGLAVVPTHSAGLVELWPVYAGYWQSPLQLVTEFADPASRPLDVRLRERLERWSPGPAASQDIRAEHLAVLTRWYHSTWRDGEWLPVEDWRKPPYRRLVNALGRVCRSAVMQPSRAGE